jgi:N6-adenosine-specific RNA methylase IME4
VNPFADLTPGHYGAILADPPWGFRCWSGKGTARAADNHYATMSMDDIARLPVGELAAPDCVLFLWICWPTLLEALGIIDSWGFTYKTCGFNFAGPYVDMFARQRRQGWDVWGHQVGKFAEVAA